jgi:hypothetical protein
MFRERADHGCGVPARDLEKHHKAGMALDERRDVRVVRPGEKISFPVTWHGAVLSLGGYDKGYTAGYTSGFRTGYAQGYSAGYTKGVADAQSSWNGLQNIFTNLNSILGDAKQCAPFLATRRRSAPRLPHSFKN